MIYNIMKRLFFVLILFVILASCQKESNTIMDVDPLVRSSDLAGQIVSTISSDDVLMIIDSLYSSENTNIWISKNVIRANDTIKHSRVGCITAPNYESWLFIVDLYPMSNWDHECLYYYVNAATKEIEIITEESLPTRLELNVVKEYSVESKSKDVLYDISKIKTKSIGRTAANASNNKWAIIISGGHNRYNNHPRYWNDCQAIYTTITSIYGYSCANTFVLMSDGISPSIDQSNGTSSYTDLDVDGVTDIDYSATRSNITSVFNTLGSQVVAGDYVIDHGSSSNGQSYINLWDEENISQTEFFNEVNKITKDAHIHIVMGQCYSGGFLTNFKTRFNTTIATACAADETSWACYSNYNYDEFVYHWTAAALGQYPNGTIADADYDNDGNVSILEAFKYANENDAYVGGAYVNGIRIEETPQYYSNVNTLGYNYGLSGKLFELPTLYCSQTYFKVGNNYTFSIDNYPTNALTQFILHYPIIKMIKL